MQFYSSSDSVFWEWEKTITEWLEIQAPHIYLGKQHGEEFAYAAENAEQERQHFRELLNLLQLLHFSPTKSEIGTTFRQKKLTTSVYSLEFARHFNFPIESTLFKTVEFETR